MKILCEKCGHEIDEKDFYTCRDGSKPKLCKKCMTMHIDNFDPNTFTWLLQMLDVPYVPREWNSIRDTAYAKNPLKMNGMSVFGRYLSKMKLKQWNKYGWEDNEKIAEIMNEEIRKERDTELKKQLDEGVITEVQYKTLASTESQHEEDEKLGPTQMESRAVINPVFEPLVLPDLTKELTDEDKIYLATKWGTLYRPQDWIELEKMYKEMEESFDIQDADTISTLKFICKTNFKMNQALDVGDLEGFQKLSKVSENLRKSAKFTAAQKKDKDLEEFDSVGAIVAFCEKEEGAIPRYDTAENPDLVDTLINNMKQYTRSLIDNDPNISQQIERYLKLLEASLQQKQDKIKAKEQGLDHVQITDEDMMKFNAAIEAERDIDAALLEEGDID